ncbi:MAG: phytanoyl-CoA dioxygenase [Alphaproteobacteria bacterium]|nr:phytanoyl-CoA dioxygenase [Alphaproteobacteria bacterium]
MTQLSAGTIEDYRRDGAVALRGVIGADWLAALAEGIERNLRDPGPYGKRYTESGQPGLFFGDYCNWRRIPQYREFMTRGPAAALAAQLMGSRKVNLFHEHVLVKEPGTLEPTPWHQDLPYYSIDGTMMCSMWIPIDPVPAATCPQYLAGSHRWGKLYAPKRFKDQAYHPGTDPNFSPLPDIEAEIAEGRHRVLRWDLAPGDCIAFDGRSLHGAPPNPLSRRRRAFSARWTGDDVTFLLRPGFMSPPPPENHPPVGAPMDCEAFPVVYRAP